LRSSGELAWIGEPEAGVAGCSLGERRGKYWNFDVVVVMDLGRLFARVGAEDAAGVLDKATLERNRAGEEQGVERGAVKAFANEVPSSDDEQR
jgi:hypothetical protein